jgi:hypothetical protein
LQIQGTAADSNAHLMSPIPENKSIKRIFFTAIKWAVKTHILYYFLREAEPLDIHYQALPGNEKLPGSAW